MIRLLVHIALCVFPLQLLYCQAGTGHFQKQVEELRSICLAIQNENNHLKVRIRKQDSIDYIQLRMKIYQAFNDARNINFDFLNTTDKIAVTGLFTKLLQANNPTSEILGFRFHETIIKATEKHLQKELPVHEKKRFAKVVSKLVNNPVISTLANTNPITSVTAAIISTVAEYSTTTIEVEKDGNRIKDVSATTHDAFNQEAIVAFRTELQPYITFYDALNVASAKYLSGLGSINHQFISLKDNVETYKFQLYGTLQINDTNTLIKLATLLPDPVSGNLDYPKYLNDPHLMQCYQVAARLTVLQESVKEFRREYDQNLLTFLKEYSSVLESSKKLPAACLDHTKIDEMINAINAFIYQEI